MSTKINKIPCHGLTGVALRSKHFIFKKITYKTFIYNNSNVDHMVHKE